MNITYGSYEFVPLKHPTTAPDPLLGIIRAAIMSSQTIDSDDLDNDGSAYGWWFPDEIAAAVLKALREAGV